ncbi:hypothetical protein HanPI659440_Chr10g0389741 [Helianthus annuus]|nr:hypothetical protein HanPI659440_Chr10g0389741 [Helianthus annuus]
MAEYQSMSFDLGEDFVFNQRLAQALIDNRSPIRPLPEHLLLLGRVCHVWGRGDREWPVIRKSGRARDEMTLRDALKVPSFSTLDFDYDEIAEDEDPFFKQIASAAQEIRPLADPKSSEAPTVDPESKKEAAGSSVAQVRTELLSMDEDSDPEVRELNHAFIYPSSAVTSKGKRVSSSSEPKGLLRKRKIEIPQVRSAITLPMPKAGRRQRKQLPILVTMC